MNTNARKYWYILTGVIAAVMPILVQAGILDASQASLGGLLGGAGALTAAGVTHKQQKEGLHDPALSPIDAIAEAVPRVLSQQATANADVDKLRQITGELMGNATDSVNVLAGAIPIVGPMAGVATAVGGSLAQQALDQILAQ